MAQDELLKPDSELGSTATAPQWLIELKQQTAEMLARGKRPAGKAAGRWLGDFLDQDTPSGLKPAEEKLLFQAMVGEPCRLRIDTEAAEALQKAGSAPEVYKLALDVVAHMVAAPGAAADRHTQEIWSKATTKLQGQIAEQPRVLRDFFPELILEVAGNPDTPKDLVLRLVNEPELLRRSYDACFKRYASERWRLVDPNDPEVQVRANFLRFLAQGGDETAPVHEKGLHLYFAAIGETLDLEGCTVPVPLTFFQCYFADRIVFRDATTKSLMLQGSRVRGLEAESARVAGAVFLDNGFRSDGVVSFLLGAIDGRFSCERSRFLNTVSLAGAKIRGTLLCDGATLRNPTEDGSGIALHCDNADITGDVFLTGDFTAAGQVRFASAKTGGLYCSGGTFRNRTADGGGIALFCDGADIKGDVLLDDGFTAEGQVRFHGAKIGGQLNCAGGKIRNQTEDGASTSLICEHADIAGGVLFSDVHTNKPGAGFLAEGEVRFCGAKIHGDLQLTGGSFDNAVPAKSDGSRTWTPRAANAINLQDARIEATLWLGPHAEDHKARAIINGALSLQGCHAHGLVDDPSSWPPDTVTASSGEHLPASITLDGFTYDRLVGMGSYAAATRKRWLLRQSSRHLGVAFRPQPFEQLIKVLREMGHEGTARSIAKFKERRRHWADLIKIWQNWTDPPDLAEWPSLKNRRLAAVVLSFIFWPVTLLARGLWKPIHTLWHLGKWLLIGGCAGYGYGYVRLVVFLFCLWLAGGFFYAEVARQGAFATSNPVLYRDKDLRTKCGANWTECKEQPELPSFSSWTYSADIMIPVLDLGQKKNWQPSDPRKKLELALPMLESTNFTVFGQHLAVPFIEMRRTTIESSWLDIIVRTQTLLSWVALGLLIAILSGIIKKD